MVRDILQCNPDTEAYTKVKPKHLTSRGKILQCEKMITFLTGCVLFQEGETPLIKATKMRNIEIVELLLDKGARVSAVDKVTPVCGFRTINRSAQELIYANKDLDTSQNVLNLHEIGCNSFPYTVESVLKISLDITLTSLLSGGE